MTVTDQLIIERFTSLHCGREDAVGTEEGGCLRINESEFNAKIAAHLLGGDPTGVYPMVKNPFGDWVVHFGVVDFDEGEEESLVHALNLQTVLDMLNITAWVERSRSKGYHVWVYSREWVPATVMRFGLLGATQVAKAPVKEINPKQTSLGEGKIGNYIRLPYPGHLGDSCVPDRRVVIVDGSEILPLEEFVFAAHEARCTRTDIERLVPLYEQPHRPSPPFERRKRRNLTVDDIDWDAIPDVRHMRKLTRQIFDRGPTEQYPDRSRALWRLSSMLKEDGYESLEILELTMDADRRWGKHAERGDQEYVVNMVNKIVNMP
jgi:hypothetical protein